MQQWKKEQITTPSCGNRPGMREVNHEATVARARAGCDRHTCFSMMGPHWRVCSKGCHGLSFLNNESAYSKKNKL